MNSFAAVVAILAGVFAIVLAVRGFVIVRLRGFAESSPISDQVVGGGALCSGVMIAGSALASIGQSNELWVLTFSLLAAVLGGGQLATLRLRPVRVAGAGPDVIRTIRSVSLAEIFVAIVGACSAAANFVA